MATAADMFRAAADVAEASRSSDSELVAVPADYESECSECGKTIAVGSPVARMNRRWVHGECWHKI